MPLDERATDNPDSSGTLAKLPISSPLPNRQLGVWAVVLTVAFEALTCVLRFGLKLESTRDTASVLSHFTCGYRIHHSYIGGAMILLAAVLWDRNPRWMSWCLVIGLGLFFSDMIHHFLVLWPVFGSPQFDLTYPATDV
ncbi:MAG: hypothetical protein ABJZ55_10630 [Fuerstiella sp.]